MQFDNVGLLRDGDWNPGDPDYDSLALWHRQGTELDLRIPWAMAGMSDPSSHQALIPLGEFRATSTTIPGIGLTISGGTPAVQAGTAQASTARAGTALADRGQGDTVQGNTVQGNTVQAGTVRWQNWQIVSYTERIKPGAGALRQAFNTDSSLPHLPLHPRGAPLHQGGGPTGS
jgi:hypothetical protein